MAKRIAGGAYVTVSVDERYAFVECNEHTRTPERALARLCESITQLERIGSVCRWTVSATRVIALERWDEDAAIRLERAARARPLWRVDVADALELRDFFGLDGAVARRCRAQTV